MTSNAGWTERTRPPVGRQQSRADRQKRDAVSHPARPQPLCEKRENRTAGRSCPPRLFSVSNGAGRRLPESAYAAFTSSRQGEIHKPFPQPAAGVGFKTLPAQSDSLFIILFLSGESQGICRFLGRAFSKTSPLLHPFVRQSSLRRKHPLSPLHYIEASFP